MARAKKLDLPKSLKPARRFRRGIGSIARDTGIQSRDEKLPPAVEDVGDKPIRKRKGWSSTGYTAPADGDITS